MNANISPFLSLRSQCLLSLVLLALMFSTPARAQWRTTEWVVMNAKKNVWDNYIPPLGERAEIAEKHRVTLEAASIWYQSLGFPAPFQQTEDGDLKVDQGEAYLGRLKRNPDDKGSYHDSDGEMMLTSHPDFLSDDTPYWNLMKASAVHELYHGIQDTMSPSLTPATRAAPENPQCLGGRGPDTDLSWLIEGTAAMVQIRWLEGRNRVSWGHPFKGSHRAAWVRHFDQSLAMGAIPPEHQVSLSRPEMTTLEIVSWLCDYGTWYFWYAIGDMIGRTDGERVAYTRYIFAGNQSWANGGVANVDSGLKAAAADYNAIRAYRGGLYDLYPQFVAQYLTEERFYGHLEEVTLGAPDLYKTSSLSGGPLEPLASRAWRVRVRLPQDASPIPYKVRFTLDAPDGTDRDDLHLIVGDAVAKQPYDRSAPYTDVEEIDPTNTAADGTADYLVRVANVARDAAKTANAEFSLRVEVEGYYGDEVTGGLSEADIGAIAGDLPPGFAVRGPKQWSCSGDKTARAIFDLVTPNEKGRDFERAMPDFVRSMEGVADKLDIITQRAERGNVLNSGKAQQLRDELEEGRATLDGANPEIKGAAAKARARQTTKILATFVGSNDGEMCQMLLSATLKGSEGGPQSVAGAVDKALYPKDEAPVFNVEVAQKAFFDSARRGFRSDPDEKRESWNACTMTTEEQQKVRKYAARVGCEPVLCSPGRMTLEAAEQGRIAGTFEFDVLRERTSGRCDIPLGRDKVVGHFNVHSTDDGYDDDSLFGGLAISGVPAGLKGGAGAAATIPGAPIIDLGDAVGNALDNLDLSDF